MARLGDRQVLYVLASRHFSQVAAADVTHEPLVHAAARDAQLGGQVVDRGRYAGLPVKAQDAGDGFLSPYRVLKLHLPPPSRISTLPPLMMCKGHGPYLAQSLRVSLNIGVSAPLTSSAWIS